MKDISNLLSRNHINSPNVLFPHWSRVSEHFNGKLSSLHRKREKSADVNVGQWDSYREGGTGGGGRGQGLAG